MKRVTLFPVLAVLLICSAFKSSDYEIDYDSDIHQSHSAINSLIVAIFNKFSQQICENLSSQWKRLLSS
jgi:hypothetical protein